MKPEQRLAVLQELRAELQSEIRASDVALKAIQEQYQAAVQTRGEAAAASKRLDQSIEAIKAEIGADHAERVAGRGAEQGTSSKKELPEKDTA